MSKYKTVTTSLLSILKDPDKAEEIIARVDLVNRLVTRTLLFLKLYLLHSPKPVTIDRKLVDTVMRRVGTRKGRALTANQGLWDQMTPIYEKHFAPLLPQDDEPLPLENMWQVLRYAADRIVVDYKANVVNHFPDYVQDYVDHYYSKWKKLKDPTMTTAEKDKFKSDLEKIGKDVLKLEVGSWKSTPDHHAKIRMIQRMVLPYGPFDHNDLLYDRKARPEAYLKEMRYITTECGSNNDEYRFRNVVPLRTSLIPAYVRLDTYTLIQLFMPQNGRTKLLQMKVEVSSPLVWSTLFKTNAKVFRKTGYHFANMIETDGVAVAILFEKDSDAVAVVPDDKSETDVPYVTHLLPDVGTALARRTVVGVDPGMSDLMSLVSEHSSAESPQKLRYTQKQRVLESRSKKYATIIQRKRNTTVIAGKTVTAWESYLGAVTPHGSKDWGEEMFSIYLKGKLLVNHYLAPFYEDPLFRKLRFNGSINTQRSEQQFINRVKEKFGSPRDVVICYGDWSETHHRKNHAPVKGVGFRKMFRQAGYDVVLVNEHRTSHYCSSCCDSNAYCREVLRPKKGKSVTNWNGEIHGLLQCTTCKRKWNRDVNAPINIAMAARCALDGVGRPVHLMKGQKKPVLAVRARRPVSTKDLSVVGVADTASSHGSTHTHTHIIQSLI
jgi:hypothetical protein